MSLQEPCVVQPSCSSSRHRSSLKMQILKMKKSTSVRCWLAHLVAVQGTAVTWGPFSSRASKGHCICKIMTQMLQQQAPQQQLMDLLGCSRRQGQLQGVFGAFLYEA